MLEAIVVGLVVLGVGVWTPAVALWLYFNKKGGA